MEIGVVRHLRRVLLARDADISDRELLARFLTERDEAAFAGLVRRHGPMVLSVCRRVLGNVHDAEDAFQATFLVLVRKAATIGRPDLIGNWLFGVAHRTALEARTRQSRRQARECTMDAPPDNPAPFSNPDTDWLPMLDREIQDLPEAFRVPVVLCELEGRPRREVARLLDLPEGTLSSRLATARKILARRLARRGFTLTSVSLAAVLADRAAANVPPRVLDLIVQTAMGKVACASPAIASLVEGVLRTMLMTKIKLAASVLFVVAVALTFTGVLTCHALAEKGTPANVLAARQDKKPDKPEQGPTVRGVVQSVDAAKKTITVSVQVDPKEKKTEEQTYPLAEGVKVLLEEIVGEKKPLPEGKLEVVTPGTTVTLQLSVDKKKVDLISARGPSLNGTIKSVDAAKNTVVVTTKGKDGVEEKTLPLLTGAKVLLNDGLRKDKADEEGQLAKLTEGTRVHIPLTVDRKSALAIRVEGESLQGTLKGFDKGNATLTITVKEDGQLVDKVFTLSKDAQIDGDLKNDEGVAVVLSVFDPKVVVRAKGQP